MKHGNTASRPEGRGVRARTEVLQKHHLCPKRMLAHPLPPPFTREEGYLLISGVAPWSSENAFITSISYSPRRAFGYHLHFVFPAMSYVNDAPPPYEGEHQLSIAIDSLVQRTRKILGLPKTRTNATWRRRYRKQLPAIMNDLGENLARIKDLFGTIQVELAAFDCQGLPDSSGFTRFEPQWKVIRDVSVSSLVLGR